MIKRANIASSPSESKFLAGFRKGQNPGLISKEDADAAANLAKLINLISIKFPKDRELDAASDINTGALAQAPGEERARGENNIKREEPFNIDEVKAASSKSIFKLALFDPNIDPFVPENRGSHYSGVTKSVPAVEQTLSNLIVGPQLGDLVANATTGSEQTPADDTRNYGKPIHNQYTTIARDANKPVDQHNPQQYGAIQTNSAVVKYKKEDSGQLSRSFLPNDPGLLKASSPIPDGNVMLDDEYNNPNEDTNLDSQRPLASKLINKTRASQTRPSAGFVAKQGTFVSYYLRKYYEHNY